MSYFTGGNGCLKNSIIEDDHSDGYEEFQRCLGLEVNQEAWSQRGKFNRITDMCEQIGVSRDYFSDITRGKYNLSLFNLYRIANVLGVSIEEFIRRAKKRMAQTKEVA